MKLKKFLACVLGAGALMVGGQASAIPVAVELVLLVDVSGSVDTGEYNLQKGGYVSAFQNPTLHNNIASFGGDATGGGIAVTYVEWSGANQQSVQVTWTHIYDAATANAFASAINGTSRAFSGLTAPGNAINVATGLFSNGFEGDRLVIDVSGDGAQNDGVSTSGARDAALAAGVNAINGLAILGEAGLETWYNNNIKGGTGAFVLAATFDTFANTVLTKIGREINETPEPASLALVGLALAGMGFARRATKKA